MLKEHKWKTAGYKIESDDQSNNLFLKREGSREERAKENTPKKVKNHLF